MFRNLVTGLIAIVLLIWSLQKWADKAPRHRDFVSSTLAEENAGAAMPRVQEIVGLQFVTKGGSDTNDGLSWGTAKRTIYGALASLPGGGSDTAGSGTIYVGPGAAINPTPRAGVWLMSAHDPNYNKPPAGWLKCPSGSCNLNIVGMGNEATGPNGHRPRVELVADASLDNNHPGIWLSGTAMPIHISNFQIPYSRRAIVLGECSNNDRTGRCGVQSDVFENVGAIVIQSATSGPCTDIASNVFWIWFRDFGCAGNAYSAKGGPTADNAAAVLVDGSAGSGSGLIYLADVNFAGGGIKFKPGSNGGSLYVRNAIQEGDFAHAIPPTIWFTGWFSPMDAVLDNIQNADGGQGSSPVIKVDSPSEASYGPTILNSAAPTGVATVINPVLNSFVAYTSSPLTERQSGFFNGYVVGLTDVGRRLAALIPARFVNHAISSPSGWTFPQGSKGVTFTQGLKDPFGGTAAARVAFVGSSQQLLRMGAALYTPHAGDWIVAGVWAQDLAQTGGVLTTNSWGSPSSQFSSIHRNNGLHKGDGQWQYLWLAEKVASGASTEVDVAIHFSNAITPTLYGPTLYIIPAGTLSDNEVLEFVSSMNSMDSACEPGQICGMAGHPFVVSSYRTMLNCSSTASPAKCEAAPAGSFILGPGITTAKVNTSAVTANSQIMVVEDSSLGARLGVSCAKTPGRTYMVTDRVPGQSFTISSSSAPTDKPACLSFQLLN